MVTEAEERELSSLPSLDEMNASFHPSENFQKRIKKLIKLSKKKQTQKEIGSIAKHIFLVMTTVVTIFSCSMLPVQAVREAVISTMLNWRDQFVEIIYSHEDNSNTANLIQNVELTYLPEDLVASEPATITATGYRVEYQSNQGKWLILRILSIQDEQTLALDDEYSSIYHLSFDGHDGLWGITSDGSNVLLWQSNELSYQINSNCDLPELIKIAQGIRTITSSSNGIIS